jgi:hypothetical protein
VSSVRSLDVQERSKFATPQRCAAMNRAIDALCSRHPLGSSLLWRLRSTLAETLRDPSDDVIEYLVARSYRHSNGFGRILVTSFDSSSFEVALHFWPTLRQVDADGLSRHTHRSSFVSQVIDGVLTEDRFRESSSGATFEVFKSVPRKSSSPRTLPWLRTSGLLLEDRHVHGAETWYSLDAEIHNAYNVDTRPAITLCVSSAPVRDALVYTRQTEYVSRGTPPLEASTIVSTLNSM